MTTQLEQAWELAKQRFAAYHFYLKLFLMWLHNKIFSPESGKKKVCVCLLR